jgi:RimJ/RimL family protein N-acetyltransferase
VISRVSRVCPSDPILVRHDAGLDMEGGLVAALRSMETDAVGTWAAMPSELVTARLHLGPWRDSDIDPYFAMVHERDQRAAAAPRNGRPSRDDLIAEIEQQRGQLEQVGICLYAIRSDERYIGYCGLAEGHISLDEPEIAFELLRAFHGRGYATEAVQAVVTAASTTGRGRLWASVRTWNESSFRVLARAGFVSADRLTTDEFGDTAWWTRDLAL